MKKMKKYRGRLVAAALAIMVSVVPVFARGAQSVPPKAAMQTGVSVQSNEKAAVDASNIAEGYVLVKYTGGKNVKIKVQITKGTTYTYNLNNQGANEVFPLTEGNGAYSIKVFENTEGNKYAQAYSCSVNLNLRNEFLPFLYPNQYVNFTDNSQCVGVAAQIAAGKSDIDKLTAIYEYVVANISYDYNKAATVQPGYLPNNDTTLATRTGICFDYASLMGAMLRSQNIPCKLVVGYAGEAYHAWINVYLEGQGWVEKAIYFDGQNWTLMDPTFASTGGAGAIDYITNNANYTMKYAY